MAAGESGDLAVRVNALSAAQRRALAEWLAKTGASGPQRSALVACVECSGPDSPTPSEVRTFLQGRLPDYMVPQRIVVTDRIPRAPGGKLERARLLARLREADEPPAAQPERTAEHASGEFEAILAGIWAEVLGMDSVGPHENFFEVGGDSLLSIRIMARAARAGVRIDAEAFFAHPTVAGQAAIARSSTPGSDATGPVTGTAPMTPIQHWFFEHITAGVSQWNQASELAVDADVDRSMIERALQTLLLRHDALRATFPVENGQRVQRFAPLDASLPLSVHPPARDGDAAQRDRVDAAARELHASLDVENGPLFAMALVPGEAGDRLLVVAHHLVIDGLSWRIVLEDLDQLLDQIARGEEPALPRRTTSFKAWSERLAAFAAAPALANEAELWCHADGRSLPDNLTAAAQDIEADAAEHVVRFDAELSARLLVDLPRSYRASTADLLLAAMIQSIGRWSGSDTVLTDIEGHGREALFDDVDVSRTVGWFTSVFPLSVRVGKDAGEALAAVKAAFARIPNHGIGHGLLRYGDGPAAARLASETEPAFCFNFLGRIDWHEEDSRRLEFVRELNECSRAPQCPRAFVIEVNSWVGDGRLTVAWRYNRERLGPDTVAGLAEDFAQALGALQVRDDATAAASDFPLAGLDDDEFAALSAALGRVDGDDPAPG